MAVSGAAGRRPGIHAGLNGGETNSSLISILCQPRSTGLLFIALKLREPRETGLTGAAEFGRKRVDCLANPA
jgi:hypothetical protein